MTDIDATARTIYFTFREKVHCFNADVSSTKETADFLYALLCFLCDQVELFGVELNNTEASDIVNNISKLINDLSYYSLAFLFNDTNDNGVLSGKCFETNNDYINNIIIRIRLIDGKVNIQGFSFFPYYDERFLCC